MKEIGDIDDHDNVLISLTFPSGSLGCIDLSRFANYGYDQRLEVFGAKGMVQVKNVNPDNTGEDCQEIIDYSKLCQSATPPRAPARSPCSTPSPRATPTATSRSSTTSWISFRFSQ